MDDAVAAALEFQRTHPDTLVLVSADHSHTSQIIPVDQDTARLLHDAPDGRRLADPDLLRHGPDAGQPDAHRRHGAGGAAGPHAADMVGTIDQTELFHTLIGRD